MKLDTLDDFTRAYIECALWAETDNADESGGEPLDRNYCIEDIHAETLARMVADCASFLEQAQSLIDEADMSPEQAGHDFWLTRQRHGAGFWDRGLDELGGKLTALCRPYGEFNLYVGDDNLIHGS